MPRAETLFEMRSKAPNPLERIDAFRRSVHLLEDKEIRCTESPWVAGISYATSIEGTTCVQCLRKAAQDLKETINGLRLDLEMGRKGEFPPSKVVHSGHFPCGAIGESTFVTKDVTCPKCLHKWGDTFHEKLEKVEGGNCLSREAFGKALNEFVVNAIEAHVLAITHDLLHNRPQEGKVLNLWEKANKRRNKEWVNLMDLVCGEEKKD